MTVQSILEEKGDRLITVSHATSVGAIAKILSAERIGAVVVTDDSDRLAGILSERDIVRLFADDPVDAADRAAADVMTRAVVTCTVETAIEEALALMSAHAIRHLPVVQGTAPLGLISVRDLLDVQRARMLADLEQSKLLQANLIESQRQLELQSRNLEESAQHLARARDEALAASRTKSEFLATMSHELRTPLNAIIGFSQVIKAEELGPVGSSQYYEFVSDIHSAGLHLLDLINDILDLAKVEAGKDEINETIIDVGETMGSVVSMMRNQSDAAGVEVIMQIDEDLPPLRADIRKIKQIITNLLSNGVKFTPAGGRVTMRATHRASCGYRICVCDTGIGIASEDIPKALSHFGQVESDLNRRYDGTGLGLPLTRALVELHGGTLDLRSEVAGGTTVTVRFPESRVLDHSADGTPAIDDRAA